MWSITASGCTKDWLGKAGTEATSAPVLECVVPMPPSSDDLPETWTTKTIVLVESVTLGKTELTLVVEEADVTLTATVKPEGTDITWTSSNPAVAIVEATDKVHGKVHAVSAGEVTITVQAGDKSATCKVTVKPAVPRATVTTKPTANSPIYEASGTELVSGGVASGGTMMYWVTDNTTKPTSTEDFKAEVPTAKAELGTGIFYVWYYVKADADFVDSDIYDPIEVKVEQQIVTDKP